MAIKITCIGCGKVLHVPDAAAGKKGKCPQCGAILQVPAAVQQPFTEEALEFVPPDDPPLTEEAQEIIPPYDPPPRTPLSVEITKLPSTSMSCLGKVLIVLVILGAVIIVAGFLLPMLAKAQESARRARCKNNVMQIGLAMLHYAEEHDGQFPPLVDTYGNRVPTTGKIPMLPARTTFAVLMKDGYISTPRVFICPGSEDRINDDFPAYLTSAPLQALILGDRNCSYGCDPTKTRNATCAILGDKPPVGVPYKRNDNREKSWREKEKDNSWDEIEKKNSPNHNGEGQFVFYYDGSVDQAIRGDYASWCFTTNPLSGIDTDIYEGEAGYELSKTDAKIIR